MTIGLALTTSLLALPDLARAQGSLCRWAGAGASNRWSDRANWIGCHDNEGGTPPRNGDALVFDPGALQPVSVNDLITLRLASVDIDGVGDGNTAFSLSGNVIALAGTLTIAAPADAAGNGASVLLRLDLPGSRDPDATAISVGFTSGVTRVGRIHAEATTVILEPNGPLIMTEEISGGAAAVDRHSVRVIGASTATFAGDNTYTGSTQIDRGTLIAATSTALGAPDANGRVLIEPAATLLLGNGVVIDQSIAGPGGTIAVPEGATATLAGDVSSTQASLEVDGTLTIAGKIDLADPVFLIKEGDGTLVVTNPANRFHRLDLLSGTVRVGAQGAIPVGVEATLSRTARPARLDLNGFSATFSRLNGDDAGRVDVGAGTLTVDAPASSPSFYSGAISGTGRVVKKGDSDWGLGGAAANTFTGTTTVDAGGLILFKTTPNATIAGSLVINGFVRQKGDQIANEVPVTINAGGELLIEEGQSETFGALLGDGDIDLEKDATLFVGGSGTPSIFAGTIRRVADPNATHGTNITFAKAGLEMFTLRGRLDVDRLSVLAGTFVVDSTATVTSAEVTVSNGVFAGTGTIEDADGNVPLVSRVRVVNGAISPGPGLAGNASGPGVLHADAVDLPNGSLLVQLNGAAPGTGYDQLALTDNLTLGDSAALLATRSFEAAKDATFTIVSLAPGKTVTGTFRDLAEGATLPIGDQSFRISYHGGDGNDIVLTALEEAPLPTYYLSEGATGGFFDTDILLANPNPVDAPVTLTFSKENGEQVVATRTVPKESHLTVHMDAIAGLEETAASTQVTSDARQPLLVERSMFWDASYYAGHTGSALDKPAADWFFAEGSQGFFQTYVLVINPNPAPADVTFTFFREDGAPVVQTIALGATTRLTLDAGTIPDLVNRSFGIAVHASAPIMAERSMYFGSTTRVDGTVRLWSGGHESAGVTSLSNHWFLAEGATGSFFDTFVLLSNPNAADAHVTLKYLIENGPAIEVTKTIAANARLTQNIEAEDDERLHSANVSTVVTSDQPIIAERSMYWPGVAKPWGEGHNSLGVVDASTTWGLAEGRAGGPHAFHTYILLANPEATPAEVTITYLREAGAAPVVQQVTVPAAGRLTVDANAVDGLQDSSFGAIVHATNGVPVIVERSMYWDLGGVVFSGGTNAVGIPR